MLPKSKYLRKNKIDAITSDSMKFELLVFDVIKWNLELN